MHKNLNIFFDTSAPKKGCTQNNYIQIISISTYTHIHISTHTHTLLRLKAHVHPPLRTHAPVSQACPVTWETVAPRPLGPLSNRIALLLQALEMIRDIRNAFNELLSENDWMDEKTKAVAKQKVGPQLRPAWSCGLHSNV